MKSIILSLNTIASILLLSGCATIDPVPINDTNATAKGIRYFETRPFVVVHKPFPLESESVLVDGMVSPDGMTFLVTGDVQPPFTHYKGSFSALNGRLIVLDPDAQLSVKGQGEGDSEDEKGDKPPAEQPGAGPGNESTAGSKVGRSSITVTTDNTGVPIIALNEHVSLIYLPDYDREFVMSGEGRFGVKNITLVRGPGGTLLGMNASVDNSALLDPLVKAYGSIVSAGSKALVASLSPGGAVTAVAQGASAESAFPEELRGKPFTFRLHHIKFAAVGVYPFVKPSEVASYASVANTKVIQPMAGYQIPYRYFELLVAEPLFVDDVLAFSAAPRSAGNSSGECTNQLETWAANSTDLTGLLQSFIDSEIVISNVTIDKEEPEGCVKAMTVTIGKSDDDSIVALIDNEMTQLQIPFDNGNGLENTDVTFVGPG